MELNTILFLVVSLMLEIMFWEKCAITNKNQSDNSYTHEFPVNDYTTKKDDIKSLHTGRPFSSGRNDEDKKNKDYNSSGTTLNDVKDKNKK